MGKSYGVVEWAEATGNQLTLFTSRHELYGQYKKWCSERGLTYRILPAFHRECETMGGDYPIEGEIQSVYATGISGADIHENSKMHFGKLLPCQVNGRCSYMEQRDFDPDEYDVLIGHYLQAHNENYIEDRYVAYDEFPGDAYFFEPTHNEATRAITNYLQIDDDLPFENWKQLTRRRFKPEYQDAIDAWKDDMSSYAHRDTRRESQQSRGFHAHAPLLAHAGLEFELLDNEWEVAELDAGRVATKSPDDEWTVLIPPPLYAAESVVALDGTPTITKWRLILGGDWVYHEEVLESNQEKRTYLRDVLSLQIVQTNAGTKPYQSGAHVNHRSDGALLENIHEQEGQKPAVITSKQAKEQYVSFGVDKHIERAEHYGNLKGSNEFAETRLGAVIGSPHPPEDEAVERWGALNGDAVSRKEDSDGNVTKGNRLDFGPLGNALFADVVGKEVLQAVMRFGRTASGGEKGAIVYVHTSRLPRWINPHEEVTIKTWSKGMQEIVLTLRESDKWPDGEWTNKEIAEGVSIQPRQVGKLMQELEEEGYVTSRRGGRGNAYHWSNVQLEKFAEFGRME